MRSAASWVILGLAVLLGRPALAEVASLVVVLPLDASHGTLSAADRVLIEESIRTTAGSLLTPRGYRVLTGDTTLEILRDNGVDPGQACEASCALQAARELKAAYFISGTVATSESEHFAFIRLFESRTGGQLSAIRLRGRRVHDLLRQFDAQAGELLDVLPPVGGGAGPTPQVPPNQAHVNSGSVAPVVGQLTVAVKPREGAVLELQTPDGQALTSSAPYQNFQAAAGRWHVKARAEGYEDAEQSFDVPPDEPTLIKLELKPLAGLSVTGTPAGALVTVSGPGGFENTGGLPWEATHLPAGEYHVNVSRPGYAPFSTTATLEPGKTATVSVTLERAPEETAPPPAEVPATPAAAEQPEPAQPPSGIPVLDCGEGRQLPILLGWCADGTAVGLDLGALVFSRADKGVIGAQASIAYSHVGGDLLGLFQLTPGWSSVDGTFAGLAQIGGVTNVVGRSFAGLLQFSLANNEARAFFGLVQLTLGRNLVERRFIGLLQFGAWNHVREAAGLQIGAYNDLGGDGDGGFDVSGYTNDFLGIQLGAWNHTDRMLGIQLGGVNANGGTGWLVGLEFGLWSDAGELWGLQLGGRNSALYLRGIQLGLVNQLAKAHFNRGLQIGIWNDGPSLYGAQFGLVNTAQASDDESPHGMQVGAVNVSDKFTGLQVGVINYAGELSGLQLGVLNIMSTPFRIVPVANIH